MNRLTRALPLNTVLNSPWFWLALALKIVLSMTGDSAVIRNLFLPFVNYYVSSGFSDPWTYFESMNQTTSFPYPPLMLYVMSLPQYLWLALKGGVATEITRWDLLVFRLPCFAADLLMLGVLLRWFPNAKNRVLWAYWASPIVLYVSYWHGQLDILPTAVFLVSVDRLRGRHFTQGLIYYALALGLKLHLVVALPFLLVYIVRELKPRHLLKSAGIGLATFAVLLFPYVLRGAFQRGVLNTPEQLRALALHLDFGDSNSIYVAPFLLMLLLFRFSAYPKRNWDLFMLYLGIVFCAFVVVSPPAPGYFCWSLPFIVYFVCRSSEVSTGLYVIYCLAYLAFVQTTAAPAFAGASASGALSSSLPIQSLSFTLLEAAAVALIYQMYKFGVRSNAIYHTRATPVVLGISGDSGAGKDVFCNLLKSILGETRACVVSGDNYHRWPRGHEQWKAKTHLDPNANDLYLQLSDTLELARGRGVSTVAYDHKTGKLSGGNRIDPKPFLLISGLHSLLLDEQRSLFDLSIFLNPSESLRRYWKVRRDTKERGYSPEQVKNVLASRMGDRRKYILPQVESSDLVVSFGLGKKVSFETPPEKLSLTLEVTARNSIDFVLLMRHLSTVPTLKVEHEAFRDHERQTLRFAGDVSGTELQQLASTFIPNLEEISPHPIFAEGLNGVMQLIVLTSIAHKMRFSRRQSDRQPTFESLPSARRA